MKRILVGLDGSPRADAVLAGAADLASKYGAKLVLFRAISIPAEMPEDIWKSGQASLIQDLTQKATDYLQACAGRVPAEMLSPHRFDVAVGTPWQAICSVAEHEKADLIVIGSHGYGKLDRILGTTAAKVVNHAQCSVLVLRSTI